MNPSSLNNLELQRSAVGIITQIELFFIVFEFPGGERANLLQNRWPDHLGRPGVGLTFECRYLPIRHEVVEIVRAVNAVSAASNEASPHSSETSESVYDPDYFERLWREGRRYDLMMFLRNHAAEEHLEWYQQRKEQAARYADPKRSFSPHMAQALQKATGVQHQFQLYLHQAQALEALRAGHHVLLVTQTASGKTLCYNPAIFETILESDPSARALYIFPLNALLMDQNEKINDLRTALAGKGTPIDAALLIGGLAPEERADIARRCPHIIGTNPEMLSLMLQSGTGQWRDFFSQLRFVVIDEIHFYRGLLGVHMAGLLRRLALMTRKLNAAPQYVLCSATISNPLDLAHRLTTLPPESFTLLDERNDGSRQAIKHWAVFSPFAGRVTERDAYLTAAATAMVDLLCAQNEHAQHSPVPTVLFAKSMRAVNKAYEIVRRNLAQKRPDLAAKVKKFIGAELTPREKRDIYNGLRNGTYVGVVSTNALEAGVDIGALDACIIAGFPFTMMRMRQMAGRVGRKNEGLVLFVPDPSAHVDEYYREDPGRLLSQPPEVFVVDAENPYIARKHVNAAACELGSLSIRDSRIFGRRIDEILVQGERDEIFTRTGNKIFGKRRDFTNIKDLYAIQNIRANVQRPYVVCPDNGRDCPESKECYGLSRSTDNQCNYRIAVIDQQYVYRDCHPGAVYESPSGQFYEIVSLDDNKRSVRTKELPNDTNRRTSVDENTSITIVGSPHAIRDLPNGARIAWGRVHVTRSFDGYLEYDLIPYRKCRKCKTDHSAQVVNCPDCGHATEVIFRQSKSEYMEFPPPYNENGFKIELDTMAAWLIVPPELESHLADASACKLPGDQNKVQEFMVSPSHPSKHASKCAMTPEEIATLSDYQRRGKAAMPRRRRSGDVILYPGIYGQCLLRTLRQQHPEQRSLELFSAVTGYPVAEDEHHVCRACQSSMLHPALQTIANTVHMRYPSVALGDQADLGTFATLGHSGTGQPTVFWYDTYEGGIGAAEKVFDTIQQLFEASATTLRNCSCTTIRGCPHCTQIAGCDRESIALSKPAASMLLNILMNQEPVLHYGPFVYPAKQRIVFNRDYATNEQRGAPSASAGTKPQDSRQSGGPNTHARDPFEILRLQRCVHKPVLDKAFEIRSNEIAEEIPRISAVELRAAFDIVSRLVVTDEWNLNEQMSAYEVLEVLSAARLEMIRKIYRVIMGIIHPDVNPQQHQHYTRMAQLVNTAYERILKEKKSEEPPA